MKFGAAAKMVILRAIGVYSNFRPLWDGRRVSENETWVWNGWTSVSQDYPSAHHYDDQLCSLSRSGGAETGVALHYCSSCYQLSWSRRTLIESSLALCSLSITSTWLLIACNAQHTEFSFWDMLTAEG